MPPSRRLGWIRPTGIALALALAPGCQPKAPPPPAPPAQVEVAPVKTADVPIYNEWIGTLDGYLNAEIRAQVSGYLGRQDYPDGGVVKKGQLLFEIDQRPLQASYNHANANYVKAELDLHRQTELYNTAVASRQDYDDAVQADHGAKAELEEAALNLDFTRITSPIDGVAGISAVQIGDLVGPSTGVLTTVSTLDPIKVYFSISESSY